MMNFVQLLDCPDDLVPIVRFIKYGVYPIIQIGIPILLILMGTIDLGKAVLSSDDKEIKGAVGKLIRRTIAAVAVFFVSTLVIVVIGMLAGTGVDADKGPDGNEGSSWKDYWNGGYKTTNKD